jgi:hypothetical protein
VATQTNNPGKTILASATLPAYRLITAAGALCGADATADIVGVTQAPAVSGNYVETRFLSAGSCKLTASGAISANALVYKAASGKIGTTNTNRLVGIALEAATADGDIIEVMPV